MFFITKPLLDRIVLHRKKNSGVKLPVVVFLLILIFVCAWFTEIIGVHAIFGAFVLGIVTPRRKQFASKLTKRIEDIVVVILLPLYFTFSGLRTDISSLSNIVSWGMVALILCTACIGKIVGAAVAARLAKNTWRESWTIGFLMNTKDLLS
jgi:Kef-type K+ transport system membrane component KefB